MQVPPFKMRGASLGLQVTLGRKHNPSSPNVNREIVGIPVDDIGNNGNTP